MVVPLLPRIEVRSGLVLFCAEHRGVVVANVPQEFVGAARLDGVLAQHFEAPKHTADLPPAETCLGEKHLAFPLDL